ncbi:MAG: hypothetical protein M5R40_07410 [Anaerolineae bacterium]|nr:hypothetical protein [Anaerolineae bacterium]
MPRTCRSSLIAAAGDEAPRVRGRYSDLDAAIDAMIVCYTRLRQPPLPGILADLSDRMERAQQRVLELAVCARAAEDAGDPAEGRPTMGGRRAAPRLSSRRTGGATSPPPPIWRRRHEHLPSLQHPRRRA